MALTTPASTAGISVPGKRLHDPTDLPSAALAALAQAEADPGGLLQEPTHEHGAGVRLPGEQGRHDVPVEGRVRVAGQGAKGTRQAAARQSLARKTGM